MPNRTLKMEQDEIAELERQHRRGYEKQPQTAEEVGEWEEAQFWCDYEPEKAE